MKIYEPINGYYNQSFSNTLTPSALKVFKDSFYYNTTISAPATFLLYIQDDDKNYLCKAVLILFAGDSLNLQINLNIDSKDAIVFTGSNAAGHKLFNDLNYNPFFKFQEVSDIISTLQGDTKNFIPAVAAAISRLTMQFDSLFKLQKIISAYNVLAKTSFQQMLYQYAVTGLLRKDPPKFSLSKKERDSIVHCIYKKLPLTNKRLQLMYNSMLYLTYYYNFLTYRQLNLKTLSKLNSTDSFLLHDQKVIVKNECAQFIKMTTIEKREDLWALFMLNVLNMVPVHTFDETIDQFEMYYPNSRWLPYLRDKQKEIAEQVVVAYKLLSPVIQLNDLGATNSLKEVLSLLPAGKPVLIDLWASWCGPCLKAFQYNSKLDSFLLEKNIEKLYISIDNKSAEGKWKFAIDKYALGGYHVMANKDLIADLKIHCGVKGNDPFLIPRYLLVDGSHKVVLNDAAGPTAIKIFEKQIEEYLLDKK